MKVMTTLKEKASPNWDREIKNKPLELFVAEGLLFKRITRFLGCLKMAAGCRKRVILLGVREGRLPGWADPMRSRAGGSLNPGFPYLEEFCLRRIAITPSIVISPADSVKEKKREDQVFN